MKIDKKMEMPGKCVLFLVTLLFLAGCNRPREGAGVGGEEQPTSVVDRGNELTLTGPDGELRMSADYFPMPADLPGCFEVIAQTDGKDVFTSLWLICCVHNDTRVGEELKLERVDFCAALSSDSRNYASSFTGRMILKERTRERVVIGMEDVHFTILHGEYVLNGDLVGQCFDLYN